MTSKTTEANCVSLTINIIDDLKQWIEMAYLKRTDKMIKVESAWKLWQSMEQLSYALWDTYYNHFIDKCLSQSKNSLNSYPEKEIPF